MSIYGRTSQYYLKKYNASTNAPMNGGKISSSDLQMLLNSSYDDDIKDTQNYIVDKDLSNLTTRVYKRNNDKNDVFVVHRGSKDIQDVIDNYTYIKQTYYNNKRLDKARKIQQEAQEKYGSMNITTLGHSKGAYYAEQLGQDSKDIITLNKPVHLSDVFKRVPMNQTDIKTTYDPVSVLRPYQKGNKPYIIESKTMNILKEHTTGVLDDMEVIFGS